MSSWPLSSLMRRTAIAVTAIRQPENVGSETQTIASSGSPSSPERVGDEAVVGRVDDRREQEAVELDAAERLVPLVLVARSLRDLDQAVEGFVHAGRTLVGEMIKGFRDFIMRGNVIDLAVAVVLGAAFGAVVTRVRHRLHRRASSARSAARPTSATPASTVNGSRIVCGTTITALIYFVIVAAVDLLRDRRAADAAARRCAATATRRETPAPSDEAKLLTEIRDLLAAQQPRASAGWSRPRAAGRRARRSRRRRRRRRRRPRRSSGVLRIERTVDGSTRAKPPGPSECDSPSPKRELDRPAVDEVQLLLALVQVAPGRCSRAASTTALTPNAVTPSSLRTLRKPGPSPIASRPPTAQPSPVVSPSCRHTTAMPPTDALDVLLEPLRRDPSRSAILLDVDGVLAPIVAPARRRAHARDDPAAADRGGAPLRHRRVRVRPARLRRAPDRLARLDRLPRQPRLARSCGPGAIAPELDRELQAWTRRIQGFMGDAFGEELKRLRVRLEDKEAIAALHWRGVPDEEGAEAAVRAVAERAEASGYKTHWGRKVLEIRPPVRIDKGAGIVGLLRDPTSPPRSTSATT